MVIDKRLRNAFREQQGATGLNQIVSNDYGIRVIAIDPGSEQSAYVIWDGKSILEKAILPNDEMLEALSFGCGMTKMHLVIEQVRCYGMPAGATLFDTVFWSGRFAEAWNPLPWEQMPRMDVKMHLCKTSRAKDGNIRQALIDRFGSPGTKKSPGLTYGVKKDIWQAFALAVTWFDKNVANERATRPVVERK